ncbi:MAG: ASKHA domain-containing protein [Spirochaetota bacterium]
MEAVCFRHTDKPGKYFCSKYERYLCDECIACQDPNIYCKFRQMCFLWEIAKRGTPAMQDAAHSVKNEIRTDRADTAAQPVKITFLPSDKTVEIPKGATVLEAALKGSIYINARCSGKGVCGSCKVKIKEGKVECEDTPLFDEDDKNKGYVLACKAKITGSTTVLVPEENKARALKILEEGSEVREKLLAGRSISPFVSIVPLELTPPSLDDASSDLERVRHALAKAGFGKAYTFISLPVLRELSLLLRNNNWKINIVLLHHGFTDEIIKADAYAPSYKLYGIAVDMGTTSVVAYLVDLSTAHVTGLTSTQNRQVVCGEDVISRIICAQGKDGLEQFHDYAISTINSLVDELVAVTNVKREEILSFAVAGNTVMIQSVLKLDPSGIRTEPYVPVAVDFPVFHAKNIGLNIFPMAGVYVVPGNAAYVGGDITAGILISGLNKRESVSLFIDVGTNGEMVLGNREWIMTASCSAGPAFEGGGIRHGMRALPGAIDSVKIDRETHAVTLGTIDGELPAGICGSGMISLIASLFLNNILDSAGKFHDKSPEDRVRQGKFGPEFVVAWQKDSQLEEDIIITETDIATLIQSKAAVYAGIMTLLKSAGITPDKIERIQLAGGFGRQIDFEMAIMLGMLPDVEVKKFEYLGNSSVAGTYLALVSEDARRELLALSKKMTYLDFSSSNLFYDEYMQALFLPHTNIRSFPSVEKSIQKKRA